MVFILGSEAIEIESREARSSLITLVKNLCFFYFGNSLQNLHPGNGFLLILGPSLSSSLPRLFLIGVFEKHLQKEEGAVLALILLARVGEDIRQLFATPAAKR